ncbi:MAG: hypothetical protein AB7N80_16095 [Bdellovibrionales bacterium]
MFTLYTYTSFASGVAVNPTQVGQGNGSDINDPLDIGRRLEQSDLVIVGWAHIYENDINPLEVIKHLPRLKRLNGCYLVEVPGNNTPVQSEQLWYCGSAELLAVKRARELDIAVIGADTEVESGSADDKIAARDQFMSDSIVSALNNGASKVLMLVGGAHVTGIIEKLPPKLKVDSIRTDADYFTGAVYLTDMHGKEIMQIGKFNPAEYLRTLYPDKYPQAKKAQFRSALERIILRGIKVCEKLLLG